MPEEFELPTYFNVDAYHEVGDKPAIPLIALRRLPPPAPLAPPASPRPTPLALPQSVHAGVLPLAIDEETAENVRQSFAFGKWCDLAGDYGLAYEAYCR